MIRGQIATYCGGVIITFAAYVGDTDFVVHMVSLWHLFNDKLSARQYWWGPKCQEDGAGVGVLPNIAPSEHLQQND